MPVIKLESSKLTKEQKQTLAKEFSESASRVTGIPASAFYIFFDEYDHDSVAVGDTLLSDRHHA
ncbi:MAG: tautomerase family protein [Thermoplasmata archaeon]|nr:tautomerase family protein [Thermoplasmata archaeon]